MSLDVESYLLGKKKGGGGTPPVLITKNITANGTYNASDDSADGYSKAVVNVTPNLQNKNVTITENTTTTIQKDTGYDGLGTVSVTTNVSGGVDLSDYFNPNLTISNAASGGATIGDKIKRFPYIPIVNSTNLSNAFRNATALIELPLIDTSNVTIMNMICYFDSSLTTVPVLDTTSMQQMSNAFGGCPSLSNESLNNILKMCINTTSSYITSKTLKDVGLSSEQATICQGLSNYQSFLDAGWTTGY